MLTPEIIDDRNMLLRELLKFLEQRKLVRQWAKSPTPFEDLQKDCYRLTQNESHISEIEAYLKQNPIIQLTVNTYLQHMLVASNARATDVSMPGQLIARQGVWIGRWMPNFLIVNGPLSRFLTLSESPLNRILRTEFKIHPTLTCSRDLYNSQLFRHVRNGVAHWAFSFQNEGNEEKLVCYDFESGKQTVSVPVLVAETLNMASYSVIECLDRNVFQTGNTL